MNIETIYIEKEIKDHPNTKNILKKLTIKILFYVINIPKFLIQKIKTSEFKKLIQV